jgi:DNA-binding SARP family transcriptional activator/TolB-like protein
MLPSLLRHAGRDSTLSLPDWPVEGGHYGPASTLFPDPPRMLRLRTLGGLVIESDASPLSATPTTRHRLALLAILAVAGDRGISRDKLLGYLWSENDADRARHALTQALYALRRGLGDDSMVLGTSELRLNPRSMTSDVQDLQLALGSGDAERAIRLYEGPFLDGFFLNEPEFERWVDSERARLAGAMSAALRGSAEAAARMGDHRAAADYWRRLVALDRTAAGPALGLMRTLAAAGDHAAALQHYRLYDALIREDLDCPPSPEVTALAAAIRAEADRAGRRQESATVQTPVAQGIAVAPTDPTVGSEAPNQTTGRIHSIESTRVGEQSRGLWRRRLVRYAGPVLLIAATVFVVDRANTGEVPVVPKRAPVLAVVPFERPPGILEADIANGIAQDVVSRVAQIGSLSVISQSTMASFAGKSVRPSALRRDLGIDYLLTGTLRSARDSSGADVIRIVVNVESSDDRVIWSQAFESALAPGKMLSLQTRIAESIAEALDVRVGPARGLAGRGGTDNLDAWVTYQRGRGQWNRRLAPDGARLAIEYFERAALLDPSYALAWAWLAQANIYYYYQYGRDLRYFAAAKKAVERAEAIDPALPETRLARGYVKYWGVLDYDGALAEFSAVRVVQPNNDELYWVLGSLKRRRGDFEGGLQDFRTALRLDPRSPRSYRYAFEIGATCIFLRQYAVATTYLDTAIALNPDMLTPHVARLYVPWMQRGDLAATRARMRQAAGVRGVRELVGALVPRYRWILAVAGDEFVDSLEQINPESIPSDSLGFYYLARAEWRWVAGQTDPGQLRQARAYFDSARVFFERDSASNRYNADVRSALGLAYAGVGRADEAVREARLATQLAPVEADPLLGPYYLVFLAQTHTMLGQHEAAVALVRRLLQIPSPVSESMLARDPHFAPLINTAAFSRLRSELR